MTIQSTFANALCVYEKSYTLPTEAQLKEAFGATVEGGVNYSGISEGTLEMTLSMEYGLQMPDKKCLDPQVVSSGAYAALNRNFYELIKNSIDSCSTQVLLTIFKDPIKNKVEMIVADNGRGFKKGKWAKHFASEETIVKCQDLAPGQDKLISEKKIQKTLGGAGKGLMGINKSLQDAGDGFLVLQCTPTYPAIVRLQSSYTNNKKARTAEPSFFLLPKPNYASLETDNESEEEQIVAAFLPQKRKY